MKRKRPGLPGLCLNACRKQLLRPARTRRGLLFLRLFVLGITRVRDFLHLFVGKAILVLTLGFLRSNLVGSIHIFLLSLCNFCRRDGCALFVSSGNDNIADGRIGRSIAEDHRATNLLDALGLLLLGLGSGAAARKNPTLVLLLVAAAVLFTTSLRFAVTGVYQLTAGNGWREVAGVVGVGLGVLAVYAALAMALEDAGHRTVLPVLRRGAGRTSLEGDLRDQLERIERALRDAGQAAHCFDLAELRGYHYHSGVVFAAYGRGRPNAIALGGLYDEVGKAFGRARPATGFTLDLRELAALDNGVAPVSRILAPYRPDDAAMRAAVEQLRARGEVVVWDLPGHDGTRQELGCDRELTLKSGKWAVVTTKSADK